MTDPSTKPPMPEPPPVEPFTPEARDHLVLAACEMIMCHQAASSVEQAVMEDEEFVELALSTARATLKWQRTVADAEARIVALEEQLGQAREKAAKYDAINTPELYDFVTATVNEALHQRERWGVEQDGGKTDADWFWLIGFLAGKALHNPPKDDMGSVDARLHRIITVAAAACNWHGATLGTYALMRPGVDPASVEGIG
jgi:hypothetical protein